MTHDKFEEILLSIGGVKIDMSGTGYSRTIKVASLDRPIIFKWYVNLIIAYIDNIQITNISDIVINRHWPNKYNNINLMRGKETICIIPLGE